MPGINALAQHRAPGADAAGCICILGINALVQHRAPGSLRSRIAPEGGEFAVSDCSGKRGTRCWTSPASGVGHESGDFHFWGHSFLASRQIFDGRRSILIDTFKNHVYLVLLCFCTACKYHSFSSVFSHFPAKKGSTIFKCSIS